MALPLLNDSPKYELTIPSSGETVRFRPFLVKEQKVLLLAYEAQDKRQIIQAILDTIKTCLDQDFNIKNLTTFDVDYIFTQIRAKSVGEKVSLNVACSSCKELNEIIVNLEEIEMTTTESTEIVEMTDKISVKLKYPNYSDLLKDKTFFESESQSEMIMKIMASCLESIMTENENILIRDEPKEEVDKFIDSMTGAQFEKITSFVQKMPVMKHEVDFKCMSCNKDTNTVLQGIDDFF
jgi:ribosomal protein L44E